MSWDTIQATKHMTRAGAKSKLSSAPPAASRPLRSTTRLGTTPLVISSLRKSAGTKARLQGPQGQDAGLKTRVTSAFSFGRASSSSSGQLLRRALLVSAAACLFTTVSFAQGQFPTAPPPPPPGQNPSSNGPISVSVNLVVLHT